MVRCGIGLYGFGNAAKEDKKLNPVACLKTIISQIHQIKKGESVGYNRAYVAKDIETIATLPIGHADGISRHYGNEKGYVSIQGQKAPIIGNVCIAGRVYSLPQNLSHSFCLCLHKESTHG